MKGLHPAGRLALGMGLLAAAIVVRDAEAMVAGGLCCAVIVRLLAGQWQPVARALRWLGWLAAPMFLLHALFTPGEIIWPGWPFTVEGAWQGAYLALRLSLLFLAGMACSRMLSMAEWQACLLRAPIVGARLYPWLRLLGPMRARTLEIVRRHARAWHVRGIRRWPSVLGRIVTETLVASREEGQQLWRQWHEAPTDADWPALDGRATLALVAGMALPWMAWLA